jgi:hypothetical protein
MVPESVQAAEVELVAAAHTALNSTHCTEGQKCKSDASRLLHYKRETEQVQVSTRVDKPLESYVAARRTKRVDPEPQTIDLSPLQTRFDFRSLGWIVKDRGRQRKRVVKSHVLKSTGIQLSS